MLNIDGNKIQELRDHYGKKAEREIMLAKNDDTELSDEDIKVIENKYEYEAEQSIQKILSLSPEKMFKLGLSHNSEGWRTGYTTSPISKRVEKRRKQSKIAKKTKRKNRK